MGTVRVGLVCCLVVCGLVDVAVAEAPAAMTPVSGLAPWQVVQCDEAGLATLACEGRTAWTGAGAVEARLVPEPVEGAIKPAGKLPKRWARAGKASNGAWSARIEGVPAGGPYRLELRIRPERGRGTVAATTVDHLLAGDLWVLAGQSNMQGVGNNVNVPEPSPVVHTFAMNDEWRLAREPLHLMAESVDVVHRAKDTPQATIPPDAPWTKGSTLGLAFAREMVALTGRPVGLVPCAHGGTSMDQWNPALRDQGGASLYGSMYRRVQAVGGKVRGVLWYQGESDAFAPEAAAAFPDKFKAFVAAVRQDFNAPRLPFYYVQIGRFAVPQDGANWNRVQQAQCDVEAAIAPGGLVAAIDLELDDAIHVGTEGHKVLAARLARRAASDLYGKGKVLSGPRVTGATTAASPFGPQVVVKFTGVNGGLCAPGRVSGFSLAGPDGAPVVTIYDQQVSPDDANAIILWVSEAPKEGTTVWYGRGIDPYCNVVDQAGLALPVFGPLPITGP